MLILTLPATPDRAQNMRSWVSGTGGGTLCTRAAPCATFQTAHDATAPGGEMNCVDAGEYRYGGNALTLTKTITIDCGGTIGGHTLTNIHIAAAGIVVRLRNLSLQGEFDGSVAVNFINGAALYVEHCTVSGWRSGTGQGIRFTPPDGVSAKLHVIDSVIEENGLASGGGGIIIQTAGSGSARVVIERTQVLNNTHGIYAGGTGGTVLVQIKDSTIANNIGNGIWANSSGSITSIVVDHSSSTLN